MHAIRARAPEVEIAIPPGKPNTQLAIHYAAAALRSDPTAGRRFVRSLYRAFWADGLDLSDPAILAALADDAELGGLRPDAEAVAVADSWQQAWGQTSLGGVPLILRPDGMILYGLVDSDELREFFAAAPAE